MKYYLINEHFAEDMDCKCVEITPDDYELILDALYEYADILDRPLELDKEPWEKWKHICADKQEEFAKDARTEPVYANSLRKVAKKFEKIFKEDN